MSNCTEYLDENCTGNTPADISTDFGNICRGCAEWLLSPAW